MPLVAGKIKYLPVEEVEILVQNAAPPGSPFFLRNQALLFLIYNCALRRGEVQFLVRDDYDRNRGILSVTRLKKKTAFVHDRVLWNATRRALNKYLDSRTDHFNPLFLSRKNHDAINPHGVYDVFRNAARRAKISVENPHSLRHSFAVHSMNMGMPIELIREHLAHENINTTLIYANVTTPTKLQWARRQEASHHFAKIL